MGLVTAILEVDLEWYLAEQGNSDCFNCFDEVKRLRICICSCSFSRSNSNFDFLFKLGKIHKASSAARNVWFCKWFGYNYFMSQLEQFKTVVNGESVWLSGSPMFIMLGLVALTIAIVVFLPKVTKAVPASLVAIVWF
jgi:hypothetical protein